MKTWKRWKTILVVTTLALGAAALLLPATSFGWGEVPVEHWVRSDEAIADDEQHCPGPPVCFQKCMDFQGQDHMMPYFECF